MAMIKCTGKWIVNLHGNHSEKSFEISVVREDFEHGIRSYGWFDENKLLITHNGGPCGWPLIPMVWEHQVKLAKTIAKTFNETEFGIKEEAIVIRRCPISLLFD